MLASDAATRVFEASAFVQGLGRGETCLVAIPHFRVHLGGCAGGLHHLVIRGGLRRSRGSPSASIASCIDTFVPVSNGPVGAISGQVRWTAGQPKSVILETYRPVPGGRADRVSRPVANAPVVNRANGGVVGASVYLHGVKTSAEEWNYPFVRLELNEERPMVRQGSEPPRAIGLVRRGDAITIMSKEDRFHALRRRGAHFGPSHCPTPVGPSSSGSISPESSSFRARPATTGCTLTCSSAIIPTRDYRCRRTLRLAACAPGRLRVGDLDAVVGRGALERDPESTAVVRIDFRPAPRVAAKSDGPCRTRHLEFQRQRSGEVIRSYAS